MGQRCEFKDLDGTYLPTRKQVLIETASIAGGVTLAVLLIFIICITIYLYYRRRKGKTYFDTPEEPKQFFYDKRDLRSSNICTVLKQADLEQGHRPCDQTRRVSS